MKTPTLIALLTFQSTSTLTAYITKSEHLLDSLVISTICVLAYTVGAFVLRKEIQKGAAKRGLMIGIFMGLFSQLCGFYFPAQSGLINISAVVVCLFPQQITSLFLKVVQRKSDAL